MVRKQQTVTKAQSILPIYQSGVPGVCPLPMLTYISVLYICVNILTYTSTCRLIPGQCGHIQQETHITGQARQRLGLGLINARRKGPALVSPPLMPAYGSWDGLM